MRPPLAPSPGARLELVRLLAGLDLHGVGGVAADLHPEPVDLVPVAGREDLRQLGARDRLAPHPDRLGDDLDVGRFGEHFLRRLGPQGVDRRARHAGDGDDVALPVQLLDQPLGRHAACLFLVDGNVVGARLRDFRIVGDDHHALVARILHGRVQRRRRDRIDDDGLGTLLHHRVDLLDLALGVRPGDLDLQVDLVGKVLMGRHGLDHVGRLGLPVIADVAHRQEDLELLLGGVRAAEKASSCNGSSADAKGQPRHQCPHVFLPRHLRAFDHSCSLRGDCH